MKDIVTTSTAGTENPLFTSRVPADTRAFLTARFEAEAAGTEEAAAFAVSSRFTPGLAVTAADFRDAAARRDGALELLLAPEDRERLEALSMIYGLSLEQALAQAVAERLADMEPEHPLAAVMTSPVDLSAI